MAAWRIDDVERQRAADLDVLVSAESEAGFDLLSDGMLAWQDLFRPLVDASEGLEAGALTRFLDTNTFFRAPHATGNPATVTAARRRRRGRPQRSPVS